MSATAPPTIRKIAFVSLGLKLTHGKDINRTTFESARSEKQ